jgi:hypothetical protein
MMRLRQQRKAKKISQITNKKLKIHLEMPKMQVMMQKNTITICHLVMGHWRANKSTRDDFLLVSRS